MRACVRLVSPTRSREESWDLAGEESLDMSLDSSWEDVHRWCHPSRKQHERSCIMTMLSLADCCRHLAIDPKTLRRWLA
jgi:hypothetical protein